MDGTCRRGPVASPRFGALAAALLLLPALVGAEPLAGAAPPAPPLDTGSTPEDLNLPSSVSIGGDPDLPEILGRLAGLRPRTPAERPGRYHLALLPYVLSNPLLGVGGGMAAVGGFRLGPPPTGFSRFEASSFLTTHRQYGVLIRTDLRLPGNEWILAGDWGGGVFPNPAWGLGGETRASDRTVVHRRQVQLHQTFYGRLVSHLYAGVGYLVDDFFDIKDSRRAAGEATRFSAYPVGTSGRSFSSGVTLNLLWDGRDNTVRPTRGSYLLARFRFEPALLGSDDDWRSLYLDGRTYLEIPGRADTLALWAFAWSSYGQTPYLLLPQVAADPEHRSARGLVEGRFAARDLLYGEVEYRVHLWKALGAVAALNVSAPSERGLGKQGPLFRTLHPGLATGLRILLDRASRSNLVLDVAWAPAGELGFYLNANETF